MNCIRSFLSDRSQQVVINDISHYIKYSTIRCFADDTRISKAITCEGAFKALQAALDAVVEWSVNNNMTLHGGGGGGGGGLVTNVHTCMHICTYFCDLGPFGTHPPFVVQKYTWHFCILGEI